MVANSQYCSNNIGKVFVRTSVRSENIQKYECAGALVFLCGKLSRDYAVKEVPFFCFFFLNRDQANSWGGKRRRVRERTGRPAAASPHAHELRQCSVRNNTGMPGVTSMMQQRLWCSISDGANCRFARELEGSRLGDYKLAMYLKLKDRKRAGYRTTYLVATRKY